MTVLHPVRGATETPRTRSPLRFLLDGAVALYQSVIAPLLPRSCRFSPSCSEYARLSVRKHGAVRGTLRAAWRVARCNPLSSGGIDLP